MRNCEVGIPCGATCIDRHKKCRVEFSSDVSTGLDKTSRAIRSEGEGGKSSVIRELDNHLRRNTFALPGSKISAEDISKLVGQAAGTLQGESRENLQKMADFIVKDGQGLIITQPRSKYGSDARRNGLEAHSSWVGSPELKRLMMETSSDYKSNPLNSVGRMRVKLEGLRDLEEKLVRNIEEMQKRGEDIKTTQNNLLETRKEMRAIKEELKNPNYAISKDFLLRDGIYGNTGSKTRRISLRDDGDFSKNKAIDAGVISSQIQKVIEKRMGSKTLSPEDQTNTYSIRGIMPKGNTNEQILANYAHEIGHQVHYRSGIYDPPSDRQKVGISGYSNISHREAFAEAFVAYVFNPQALRAADKPLYDWVHSNFERALQNAGSRQLVPDF